MSQPLVTCIMPTLAGRPRFAPSAIDCWTRQTYPSRELLAVLDPGESPNDELRAAMREDERVGFAVLPKAVRLGEKRNVASTLTRGPLIAIWDDDDWSAPERLAEEVAFLEAHRLDVCGLNEMWFWDVRDSTAWRLRTSQPWKPCGGSLLFRRDYWLAHPFPDKQMGEDEAFSLAAGPGRCQAFPGLSLMVGRNHPANASGRRLTHDGNQVHLVERSEIPSAFWVENEL